MGTTLENLLKEDSDFSESKFKSKVENEFVQIKLSIVTGKTEKIKHFVNDETFDLGITMQVSSEGVINKVISLEPRTIVHIPDTPGPDGKLNNNETLQIVVPSYATTNTFADNVRIEWNFNSEGMQAGKIKSLQPGEYVALYYRETENSNYRYKIYSDGYSIVPTFSDSTNLNFH